MENVIAITCGVSLSESECEVGSYWLLFLCKVLFIGSEGRLQRNIHIRFRLVEMDYYNEPTMTPTYVGIVNV